VFEGAVELLHGRGESSFEIEVRRLLDGVELELTRAPHGGETAHEMVVGAEASDREPVPDDAEAVAVRTDTDGGAVRDGGAADVGGPDGADPDEVGAQVSARAERLDRLVAEGAGHLADARRAQEELARAAAGQARALAAFARKRPMSFDRPDGEVGAAAAETRASRPAVLTSVSEWAVDEVMVALGLTSQAAGGLLVDSLLLVERLPATLDALTAGWISWAHAQVMTDLVAPLPDGVRAAAEQRLLSRVEGRTRTQLRVAARRLVQKLDAATIARRVTEAIRGRAVTVYPGDDGMATLSVVLPAPVARAVQDALRQYADAADVDGDERTRTQRMVDCLVDLVLRPGEHGMSPVQARLTIVAAVETLLGSDEPGEVDGDLVPAAVVRQLAVALGLLPGPQPSGEPPVAAVVTERRASATEPTVDGQPVQSPAAEPSAEESAAPAARSAAEGSVAPTPAVEQATEQTAGQPTGPGQTAAEPAGDGADAEPARDDARQEQGADDAEPESAGDGADRGPAATLATIGALLRSRTLTGTALEERPHLAMVDEVSGQLVALTDATGLRSGQALGPPPESPGYRPGRTLDRFVRLRDRRCRFPGCRARPVRCDLDHQLPWPAGRTSHDNLCCLCRHHHRLSHQAPGWRLRGLPDGGLEWTTPGGIVATTRPPGFGTDDDLPPRDGPRDGPTPGADQPTVPYADTGTRSPAAAAAAAAAAVTDSGADEPPF
jgi:hypothetical protein